MSKKMLFIYNPMEGKEQIKNKLSEIIQIFCKEGFEVTIFATRGREDATKVIEKKGEKYDKAFSYRFGWCFFVGRMCLTTE